MRLISAARTTIDVIKYFIIIAFVIGFRSVESFLEYNFSNNSYIINSQLPYVYFN